METLTIDLKKKKSFEIGQQGDHNALCIHFINMKNVGTNKKYIYYTIDGIENCVPLTNDRFIVGYPLTAHSGIASAQLISKLNDNSIIKLSNVFAMHIKESKGYKDSGKYPVDPNIQSSYDLLDDLINETKDLINNYNYATLMEKLTQASSEATTSAATAKKCADELKNSTDFINTLDDKVAAQDSKIEKNEAYTSHITTKQNTKIAALQTRMSEFTSLKDGSTTGDAELIDARIGADGTKYPSVGDAMRGQVEQLNEALGELNNSILNSVSVENKIVTNTLEYKADDAYITTSIIELKPFETIYVQGFAYKGAVSVITEFDGVKPLKALAISVGEITTNIGTIDWYKYTNNTLDSIFVRVCIQNKTSKNIYINNQYKEQYLNDITDFVTKTYGYVDKDLNFVDPNNTDYYYSNPIKLNKGNTIFYKNWAYNGVVSMISKCDSSGHLLESIKLSDSIYGWKSYTNLSQYDEYIIVSGGNNNDKYPIKLILSCTNFDEITIYPQQTTFLEVISNLNKGKIYDGGLSGTPNNYSVYLESDKNRQLCIIPIKSNTEYTIVKSKIGEILRIQTTKSYTKPTTTDTLLDIGGYSSDVNSEVKTFVSGNEDKYVYIQFDNSSTGIKLQMFEGKNTKEKTILKGINIDDITGTTNKRILHMGDSLTALKNYPSLINDGNVHINVSCPGATFIPKVGDTFEGINFKSMVDSMISGDYSLQQKALENATDQSAKRNLSTFINTDFNSIDKIVFWYGMNDYLSDIQLGEIGETDYTKVIPSAEYCIKKLSEHFPKIELYCINISYTNKINSSGITLDTFSDKLKKLCAKYNIPIYDMLHKGGINSLNQSSRLLDGVHQNDFQNDIIARKIMMFTRNE